MTDSRVGAGGGCFMRVLSIFSLIFLGGIEIFQMGGNQIF